MDGTDAIKYSSSDPASVSGSKGVRDATDFDSLAQAFTSALRDAGARMEADATALTAQADTVAANQVQAPVKEENYALERKQAEEMAREHSRFDDKPRAKDKADDRTDRDTAMRPDDRDRNAKTDTDQTEPREDVAEATPTKPRDDHGKAARNDRDGSDDQAAQAADGATAEAQETIAETASEVAAAATAAANAPADATTQHSEPIIASVVATTPVANAAMRAGNGTTENAPSNAAAGQASGATTADAVKPVATGGNSGNANLMMHGGNQQNAAAANGAQQGDAAAQTADEMQAIRFQQQMSLSRMVGDGNRVSVQTSVTNESAALVSQPSSTLTSNVVLANEVARTGVAGQSQLHGDQPGLHGQQQGQMAAGVIQGQTAQATAQGTQAQAQAGLTDAKAPSVQAPSGAQTTTQFQPTTGDAAATGTGAQVTTQTTTTQQTAHAQHAQSRADVPQRAFVDQVSVQITKAVNEGMDKINVQMRPESMGRVEVSLEMSKDGRVHATVTADNKDTLDLLQRDARSLEKALQDAGLEADSDSLSFNLRGEGGEGRDAQPTFGGPTPSAVADNAAQEVPAELPAAAGGILPNGRIDIRA